MLDDHERAMLHDIETRLLAEDPRWSTAFSVCEQRLSRRRTFQLVFYVVAILSSAALTLLMVAAEAPIPALFFATVSGVLVWLVRRSLEPAGGGSGPAGTPPSPTGGP